MKSPGIDWTLNYLSLVLCIQRFGTANLWRFGRGQFTIFISLQACRGTERAGTDRSLRDSEVRCLCSCRVSFVATATFRSGRNRTKSLFVTAGVWYSSSDHSCTFLQHCLHRQTYGTNPLCSIHNLRAEIISRVKWIVCM